MEIICSIGPCVNSTKWIKRLSSAGMTMMRFNFSHANYREVAKLISYAHHHFKGLKVLQDLQGAKLRVGNSFGRQTKVSPGDVVVFCDETSYPKFAFNSRSQLVVPISLEGDFSVLTSARTIYMKDATIQFSIEGVSDRQIVTRVKRGGIIRAEKGINAPGLDRSKLGITTKDRRDIRWGIEHEVSVICYSYASLGSDVQMVKDYIARTAQEMGKPQPHLWAKIESAEGVANFDQILCLVEGIMLGRGDLYAEVDSHQIPGIQHQIIAKMQHSRKSLVIATYVLESLRKGHTPSIAELNDIFHCIKDGVDGFMLSGEVAVGRDPLHPLKVLSQMIEEYR